MSQLFLHLTLRCQSRLKLAAKFGEESHFICIVSIPPAWWVVQNMPLRLAYHSPKHQKSHESLWSLFYWIKKAINAMKEEGFGIEPVTIDGKAMACPRMYWS